MMNKVVTAGHTNENMQQEFRDRRRKEAVSMRKVRDITMAILILGVAVLLFTGPRFGLLEDFSNGFRIGLGVLFAVYGAFRLYRGIKGDY